jgi:hypothetical protein
VEFEGFVGRVGEIFKASVVMVGVGITLMVECGDGD